MPLSLDCGFLSKAAVLATVLTAFESVVLPLELVSLYQLVYQKQLNL